MSRPFCMMLREGMELFANDPDGLKVLNRLMLEAAVKPHSVTSQGQLVHLERNQLVFGRIQWALKTGVSEKVIRRVVSQLEKVQLLGQSKVGKVTVITMACPNDELEMGQSTTDEWPASGHSINKEQGKEKKEDTDKDLVAAAPKKVVQMLDWSPLKLTPEHQEAVESIRRKHGHKGKVSQRVINSLANEFAQARAGGLSDEQIIGEWDTRGWLGLKAEWLLKNNQWALPPSMQNRVYQFAPATQADVDFANDYMRNSL
ncbi:hypothetical protein D3C76_646470 [compost metagenome]